MTRSEKLLCVRSAEKRLCFLLRFGVPPYRGRGRRPRKPHLYRVEDPKGMRVRAAGVSRRHLGQYFACEALRVVRPQGRAPFLVATGVVALPSPVRVAAVHVRRERSA